MWSFARLARLTAIAALALLMGATALSFLGRLHWALELLTHFRVQMAAAAALLAFLAGCLRLPSVSGLAALCLAAHAIPLVPYLGPGAPSQPLQKLPLRFLLLNVLTVNERHDAVLGLVWREDPDVIGLLEVDERWLSALAPLRARYRYGLAHPQSDNFGLALFSRVPLDGLALRRLEHDAVQVAVGELEVGGRRTLLLLAHPVPPASPGASALRDRQLGGLARIRDEFPDREVVLLGDLNTSPWSPAHTRLESLARIANAARGLGYFPSWPVAAPWLRIPIDHCLLSPGLRAVSLRVGAEVGSDHLPLIVEVTSAASN